ncbi:polysaccharide lyase [Dyadobacter chenwenxiniae]|uniref:Polysaccharide lyase n=1 Tax=Dyadobacter chenwenxiniae TaxID=2906456 RepID=A0A9X1PLY3_9BACT|nr:polysaccharide lyase [Dyadobacter chenwenxiniae]MCF0062674.1 polysaccharide lyase [Dyadobacter chenwenxiniae]UON83581.1 polysaccharide lyase [Dyadobacter chenwenxiniae]
MSAAKTSLHRNVMLTIACLSFMLCNCEPVNIDKDDASASNPALPSDILASYNFDETIGEWYERNTCCEWSATLTDSVKRAGSGSGRIELRKGDLALSAPWSEFGLSPNKNREEWFAFSVYFPRSFVKDSLEESIVQWQALPDFAKGEKWRSPPLLFGIVNDNVVLEIRSTNKEVNIQGDYTFERLNLGKLAKEEWLDWVFHIRWAYDETGIIEVWKNGKLILSRVNKPNSYNDAMYPYFKIGLYKWGWEKNKKTVTNSRVIFIDEVKVGNENADYEKVFVGSR